MKVRRGEAGEGRAKGDSEAAGEWLRVSGCG